MRFESMTLVKTLEGEVAGGQRQLLLCQRDFRGLHEGAVQAVFEILQNGS
jgi:hypothetical protein